MQLPDPTPDKHIETRSEAGGAGTLVTMRTTGHVGTWTPRGRAHADHLARHGAVTPPS